MFRSSEFSITDKAFGARNAEDQSPYVTSRFYLNIGYKNIRQLIECIDFRYSFFDTLHLLLRITDRLNKHFLKAICDIDSKKLIHN